MRAYPKELKAVREFLDQSGEHLKRQVVLEARILEVSLNEGYEQGWTGAASPQAGTAARASRGRLPHGQPHRFDPQPDLPGSGGGAGFTISDGNFNVAVSLLKTQGDVNTLSSPRVTATNNQKAVIKVGTDEYFVTNASTTTTTSGLRPHRHPNVELTPSSRG